MYVEKKNINGNVYLYLKESRREGKSVRTRTVAYLGKDPLPKREVAKKIAAYTLPDGDKVSLFFKEITQKLLSVKQLAALTIVRKEYSQKIKTLDKKLLEDMFRDFKTHYIYNTNAIEGNTLTLEETNIILNDQKTPAGKELREIYDHLNARETFDFVFQAKSEISLKTIISIHAQLLKNIDARTGSFRHHNVRVVGADFSASEAQYVTTDMNLLLRWYRHVEGKLHPLLAAALFHEKFERIHPFYDGNGRTGRMILNLMLFKKGFPPLIVANAARKEYYEALSAGHHSKLFAIEPECYQKLVQFCYKQLLETYERIFSKWSNP